MPTVQPQVSPSRQAPPGPDPVLQTLALTKTYRMGEVDVHALRGVDLALYQGEFMVLIGVSGSGKSTLLNILGVGRQPGAGGPRAPDRAIGVQPGNGRGVRDGERVILYPPREHRRPGSDHLTMKNNTYHQAEE